MSQWGVHEIETDRMQRRFTEIIYHLTKSLDPYRPVIVNDGWEHTVSDILTLHDYEEVGETLYKRYTECKEQILTTEVYHSSVRSAFANGFRYQGQPILISEYGGIAFNNDGGWGYGNKVSTKEEFLRRFEDITTAVKRIPYCCGFCYTQVSDVQQEINGLLDADHNYKFRLRQSEKSMNARWGTGGQRCNKSLLRFPHNTIIVIGKDYNRKWRDCNAAA